MLAAIDAQKYWTLFDILHCSQKYNHFHSHPSRNTRKKSYANLLLIFN